MTRHGKAPRPGHIAWLLASVGASARTPAEWLAQRNEVVKTIWSDGALPNRSRPDAILPTNVTNATQLEWSMQGPFFALNATVIHHRRSVANRTKDIMIMHDGHLYTDWDYTINCFREVAQCYNATTKQCDPSCVWFDFGNLSTWVHNELQLDYFRLFMPLMTLNALPRGVPGIEHDAWGNHTGHEWFRQWQAKGDRPMRYFVEPVVLTINYALALGYERVYMMGLSGGGWTTTVLPAIDPRIILSFPAAGSLPYIFGAHAPCDYEQCREPCSPSTCIAGTCTADGTRCATWYLTQANFTELYLLAALEPGRYSLQILHENDPVCFHGATRHAAIAGYGERIMAELNASAGASGHGAFATAIVDWNEHEWDLHTKQVVTSALAEYEASGRPDFASLPCDILHHNSTTPPCPWPPPSSQSESASGVGVHGRRALRYQP